MTNATAAIMNLVASILAAMATVVLAIFARLQWKTMSQSNELVRDRWKRDDELRAEENRPKAAFGFSDCRKCNLKLSCANLGTVGFLVAGMQIVPLLGDPEKILFGKGAEIFIPVGEEKQVTFGDYKCREVHERLKGILNGSLKSRHLGVKLILQGPGETTETNLEAYRVQQYPGERGSLYLIDSWHTISPPVPNRDQGSDGHQRHEFVTCPKCNHCYVIDLSANLGIVFPVEDCGTAFESARRNMVPVARDSERSCPTHKRAE